MGKASALPGWRSALAQEGSTPLLSEHTHAAITNADCTAPSSRSPFFSAELGLQSTLSPFKQCTGRAVNGSLLESSCVHSGHRHRRHAPCPGPSWPTSTIFMGSASQRASTWHQLHQTTKILLSLPAWYRHQSPLSYSNTKARQANSGHNSRAWVPQPRVLAHSYCMYLSEVHANMVSTPPLPPYPDEALIC